MRIEHTKTPIPSCFKRFPGMVGRVIEFDVCPTRGRLWAKVIIFDKPKSLRRFWKQISQCDLGAGCLGAVNMLAREVVSIDSRGRETNRRIVCDRRYFCLIGLCREHLTTEIIVHESVHAGFCYAKRVKTNIFARHDQLDEEGIAYPAGRIAAAIMDRLSKGFD